MQRTLEDTPLAGTARYMGRAAVLGKQRWTWGQVHSASIALAARFREGATVCNLGGARAGFLIVWLAALRRGCVQVLPPSGGPADLVSILKSSADAVVVVDDATLLEPEWERHAQCLVHPATLPPADLRASDFKWAPDWEKLVVRLYTSGSTGAPQAQHKTLGQLARGALALTARLESELAGELDAIERIVCSVAPQHMFGLETSVMLPLVTGIPVQEGRPLLPADIGSALGKDPSPALWVATPLHLRALSQAGERVASTRLVVASTMPLAPGLAQQAEGLVGAPVMEIYGSTETGAVAMRRTAREPAWRALAGVTVESSMDGTQVWGSHFDSPRVLSDRIELDVDGSFRLLGRHEDLLKIGGRRASLSAMNQLLQQMPGLDDGVFFLPASDSPTERLVLIYSGAAVDRTAAIKWLRARMDPVFLPRSLLRVERLPRTAAGKLPRAALEEIHAAHRPSRQRP